MSYCCENMSITIGNFSESLEMNSEGTLCRLCMKKNDNCCNIFCSIVASQTTVKDALYDLVDLEVGVEDGLPATICPPCLKKLIEFNNFRNICHKSDAELRKSSSRNHVRSIEGEGAADDKLGISTETKDSIRDAIVGASEIACSVQPNEIFIPVPDLQLPTTNMLVNGDHLGEGDYSVLNKPDPAQIASDASDPLAMDDLFNMKQENKDHFHEESYPVRHTTDSAGNSSDLSDPWAIDDLRQDSTSYQGEEVDAEGTGAIVIDLDSLLVLAKKEPSPKENDAIEHTSGKDWEPIESLTLANESTTEGFGVLAAKGMPIQTTSTSYLLAEGTVKNHSLYECIGPTTLITRVDSTTAASHEEMGRNLVDKNLEKRGALDTDMISCCSIPDDGQFNTKSIDSLKSSRGAIMTIGEKGVCDAPNTTDNLRFNRISGNDRSRCETIMDANEEILNCLIKNPGDTNGSNENVYHCLSCRDIFKNKNKLIKHMKIHSVAHNCDAVAESSIRDVSHKTLPSCGYSSSCEPTTSKALGGLDRKRLELRQKRHVVIKETSGGEIDRRYTRHVTRSFTVEEKSTSQSLSSKSSCIRNQRNHLVERKKEKPYSCNECKKSFSYKSTLVRHVRTHTAERPFSCRICKKSFSEKGSLKCHIRTHTGEKPYICNVCSKSFPRKCYLVSHMRTHTGEKPYICNVCSKSFRQSGSLVSHMRTHTGERPFSCRICKKSFIEKSYIKKHMRTHTGEKPYICNECGKSFAQRNNLVSHMRTHTEERSYACRTCKKSFIEKSYLKKHMRTHTGERPYSCNECSKSFPRKYNLVSHMRTHTGEKPYICNVCSKSFRQSGTLVSHMRTHTGERPFSCRICKKSFTEKSYIKKHMRTHTGEKPYICNKCGKSFSKKDKLVTHACIHSGEKP